MPRESDTETSPDGRMFLTAAEVGQHLGVRKSRVYELAAGGMLPTVRLGRRILFPRRGLDQLADAAIERSRAATACGSQPGRRWSPEERG